MAISQEVRFPIISTRRTHDTELIVKHYHMKKGAHGSNQILTARLWIMSERDEILK